MRGRQDRGPSGKERADPVTSGEKDKSCSVIILYGSGPFFKRESACPQKQFHQTNPAGIKRAGEHSPASPDKLFCHGGGLYHDPDSNCSRIRRRNSSAAGGKTPYFFQARCSRFSMGGQSGRKVRPVSERGNLPGGVRVAPDLGGLPAGSAAVLRVAERRQ